MDAELKQSLSNPPTLVCHWFVFPFLFFPSSPSHLCFAVDPAVMENEMRLKEGSRWHKSLAWLSVFKNSASVRLGMEDVVMMWRCGKTQHGVLNMFSQLEAFSVSISSSNSRFLIVPFHMIDSSSEMQKL